MEKYSQFRDKGLSHLLFSRMYSSELTVPSYRHCHRAFPPRARPAVKLHLGADIPPTVFGPAAVCHLLLGRVLFDPRVDSCGERGQIWGTMVDVGDSRGVVGGFAGRWGEEGVRIFLPRVSHVLIVDDRQLHSARNNLPKAGTIIASSFTSPLDPLYLAGIFQPIFTRSYPHTRKVERITLFRAILLAFSPPQLEPRDESKLFTLKQLTDDNPNKIICVFPETTTTNGRGILPLSPSLLSADGKTKIYPVNLRYTPQDITTPVPGGYLSFIWRLLSKPTHQMRVRIASRVYNSKSQDSPARPASSDRATGTGYDTNIFDQPDFRNGVHGNHGSGGDGMHVDVGENDGVSAEEQKVLDRVGEDLARLGRVKRVGLGVQEKIQFIKVWGSRKR